MTVLVCAAHPDDEVIGAGGTIAKLSESEDVISVLFSYGDKYPFWRKPSRVMRERLSEYKVCESILGIKRTYFMGFRDLEIAGKESEAVSKLVKLIRHFKPRIIFTHTVRDGHPDHRAVNRIVVEAVKRSFINVKVLTFGINFFNFQRGLRVVFDISDTFGVKMLALSKIKSQRSITVLLKPLILFKAIFYGLQNGFRYGECFKSS